MQRKRLGQWGEETAQNFLLEKGWHLLAKNYRTPFGEIDLIFRDRQWIVFVEVRARSTLLMGRAEETIDYRKRKRLLTTASHFLSSYSGPRLSPRFDLIGILRHDEINYELNHICGIFTP
ncbi:YraN family protein [Heliobacillus mobilis]|uniref:UPF0102 protein GJ688_01765 n=1 Tax=Heliobacterium mobile TaxID=28064 RepID=A0A6I3SBJ6_HELMO|nr:YraN family protein [Heliobacterium mobile]MTV47708.1 YraN family protein [Heliobacterium mobile]